MFWGNSACCQFFLLFSTNERVDDLAAANRCCRKGCNAIKLGTEIQYIKTNWACWFLLRLWCCWFYKDFSAESFRSLLEFWHKSRWEFQISSYFWSNVNGSTDSPGENETVKNSLLKAMKISGLLCYGECWNAVRVVWQSELEGAFEFHLHACPTLDFWELFAEHIMGTVNSIWNCCSSSIPSVKGENCLEYAWFFKTLFISSPIHIRKDNVSFKPTAFHKDCFLGKKGWFRNFRNGSDSISRKSVALGQHSWTHRILWYYSFGKKKQK